MSSSGRSEFPRPAQNPLKFSAETLSRMYGEKFDASRLKAQASSLLESPVAPDPFSDDTIDFKGYIHPRALRSSFQDFWDITEGERLNVTFIESLEENPETFEGELYVEETLPEGVQVDIAYLQEYSIDPDEFYEEGGVLATGIPGSMELIHPLGHDFYIEDREGTPEYDSVEDKLTDLFGEPEGYERRAVEVLDMEYDEFKQKWKTV